MQPTPHFFAGDNKDSLFKSDAAESYMRKCPDEDTCCFSLREYMAIDFWGRKCTFLMLPGTEWVVGSRYLHRMSHREWAVWAPLASAAHLAHCSISC